MSSTPLRALSLSLSLSLSLPLRSSAPCFSGCDSWTRELIRKDILRRRTDSRIHTTSTNTAAAPEMGGGGGTGRGRGGKGSGSSGRDKAGSAPIPRGSAVLVSTHHVDDVEVGNRLTPSPPVRTP